MTYSFDASVDDINEAPFSPALDLIDAETRRLTAGISQAAAPIPKIEPAISRAIASMPKIDPAMSQAVAAVARLGAENRRLTAAISQARPSPHLLAMMKATSLRADFVPTQRAIQSAMRQLARGDGIFTLYRQALDAIGSSPRPDALRGIPAPSWLAFSGFEASSKGADSQASSPAIKEPTSSATLAWIGWERRYNTELLLIATIVLIVIALLAWLDPQSAPVPSQVDPMVVSHQHSRVDGPTVPRKDKPSSKICSYGTHGQVFRRGCTHQRPMRSLRLCPGR